MKQIINMMVALMLLTGSVLAVETSFNGAPAVSSKKVEVLYFHFTRRCTTCNNVEKVTRETLLKQYPEQSKNGQITFTSVNLDEKEGEAIGAKHKVEGQALLFVSGDKRVDLTDKAFLYANSGQEKLKAEIRKVVDNMLK